MGFNPPKLKRRLVRCAKNLLTANYVSAIFCAVMHEVPASVQTWGKTSKVEASILCPRCVRFR